MVNFTLICLAAIFESGAIFAMLAKTSSLSSFSYYLSLHAMSTGLLLIPISRIFLARHNHDKKLAILYIFAFNLFIPIFGFICALLSFLLKFFVVSKKYKDEFIVVENPRFIGYVIHEGSGFRGGQIRAQLASTSTPLEQRMKALVAMQDAPARLTGSLLKSLLSDPADDLRVLAYAVLDSKEKKITQQILNIEKILQCATGVSQMRNLHKWLAELYWELIFQNLVQGDMRVFCSLQVRLHVEATLNISDDAGLWFMLARLELLTGREKEAEYALMKAKSLKFSPDRLLPYVAELYFLQRRFNELRQLFINIDEFPSIPSISQSRDFWRAGVEQSLIVRYKS